MTYVYTGPVPREPTAYSVAANPLHYHVSVGHEAIDPVLVAGDEQTIRAGGGSEAWPGGSVNLYGTAVWVRGPKQGGLARISIEAESRARIVTVDPVGVLQAAGTWKALPIQSVAVAPGKWRNVSSGIVATFAVYVRARGGSLLIGTHMGLRYPDGSERPPSDLSPTAGGYYELKDGEGHLFPGNPLLWVWTDDAGVELDFVKFERGRSWV